MMQQINTLRRQLLDSGYHPYQVDSIIHDAVGKKPLERLSTEEMRDLIECLEEQIAFAAKCRTIKK